MGRYGLTRYGLKHQGSMKRRFIAEDSLRMVSFYGGKDITCTLLPSDRLVIKADGGIGIKSTFVSAENFTVTTTAIITIPSKLIASESLSISGFISKDIERKFKPIDILESSANVVKDLSVTFEAYDSVLLDSTLVKDISRAVLCTTGLFLHTEAAFIDIETITVNITIPPNGVLRIDTDNFVVTMNGQNVLNMQVGEWVKLAQGLQDISVSSGTGGKLEGSVTMTEVYL